MRTATASLPKSAEPQPAENADSLHPGRRLGAYELLLPLASGGMGHVWSAVRLGDFGFRRTVAIKVMREELALDPGFRRMFLDEARIASRISHGNVVEVLDLGESDGVLFLAMALVEGDSLSTLVAASAEQRQSISGAIAARIVGDVLRGLHAAHELRGDDGDLLEFVHRDVSPHNILVGLDGIAKITDFGVARAAGATASASPSGPKGKIAYMSPEQLLREHVDRRCDLFAVGVVLWELLAARRLAVGDPGGLLGRDIPHPCDVNPEANTALADVAMRALASRREDRFATAEEMADALERAAHQSGLTFSSKSVAEWVGGHAAERVLRRRNDTEAQLARTLVGDATQLSVERDGARREVGWRHRGTWRALGGVVVALALLVLGVRTITVRAHSPDALRAAAGPASSLPGPAPSPLPSTAPSPDPPLATTLASTPLPVSSRPRAESPPAVRFRPSRTSPRPRATASASSTLPTPTPKYGNPYELPSR